MTVHLVYGDAHAHPNFDNSRADLLANLIKDIQPDVVVNIGDNADLPSLSAYDKGKAMFYGRNYRADIEAHLDFEDRVWSPVRRMKKKLPFRVFCIGNHEDRISRALQTAPELAGTISLKDLELERNYDAVVEYDGYGTPGQVEVDGIVYAHYVVSGISGRALSSLHQGYQLLQKRHVSTTVGHQHILSYTRQDLRTHALNGLCLPCLTDYPVDWAGSVTDLWTRGVVVKRNVFEGDYDLEFISLKTLKERYG